MPEILSSHVTVARPDSDGDSRLELLAELTNDTDATYDEIEIVVLLRGPDGEAVGAESLSADGPLLPRQQLVVQASTWLRLDGPVSAADCHLRLQSTERITTQATVR